MLEKRLTKVYGVKDIPSSSSSDPVAIASSVTVFDSSVCASIANTPRSKHVSIAAKAVG